MKVSPITLGLMRHSAGAMLAVVAASAEAGAKVSLHFAAAFEATLPAHAGNRFEGRKVDATESKKDDGDKKKKEQRDPCPHCGMG